MNILITGATGFIGSHLTKQLLTENHTLFCTLLEGEKNPFGEDMVKSFIISNHNIDENVAFLKKSYIDGIIHLASFVQSGDHNSTDVEPLIDTNIKFSTLLLENAVKAKVKWFINTGTYWQNYKNQEYSPVNLYAATKEAFINIARLYFETNLIKFATIKLFDTYGPNDNRPKVFNLWERVAKTGETLGMSPGEQLIDISYIDDIVNAFALLATHLHSNNLEITNGSVFAIKAEKRYTLKELAVIFEKVTCSKLNINWGERPYREREVMNPWTKGHLVPGWAPRVTVEEGIKRILNSNY